MLFQVIHYLIFYLHHTHFHFFSSSRYVFILLFAHHFYLCLLAFYLSISYLLSYLICWNSLHILLLPILFIPFPIPPFTLNLLFIFFFILIFILTFYVTLRYSVLCLHSTSFSSFSFFLFTFLPLPSSSSSTSLKVIRRVNTDYGQQLYLGTCLQHTSCSYCTQSTTTSLSGGCNI